MLCIASKRNDRKNDDDAQRAKQDIHGPFVLPSAAS
jgi:hypothetical protein